MSRFVTMPKKGFLGLALAGLMTVLPTKANAYGIPNLTPEEIAAHNASVAQCMEAGKNFLTDKNIPNAGELYEVAGNIFDGCKTDPKRGLAVLNLIERAKGEKVEVDVLKQ